MTYSVKGERNFSTILLLILLYGTFTDACQKLDNNTSNAVEVFPPAMLPIVPRGEWNAREPKLVEHFSGKIPFVIIHHSYIPDACYTAETCKAAMRQMQDMHQLKNRWNDIGYSFVIGGDGRIYHGRGYNVVGAHAPRYNDKSIGICLIGDWRIELPGYQMLNATMAFIEQSARNGLLTEDYKLIGHRQVRATECPGQRLFEEISKWDHFSSTPSGPEDTKIPN